MIAFVSDIHSNLPALQAVFEDISKDDEIKSVICLGDITSHPETDIACLDLVMNRCDIVLRGNHDVIGYDPMINRAMQPYLEGLIASSSHRDSFPSLPFEALILDDQVHIAHASPNHPVWHQCYSGAHLIKGFSPTVGEDESEFDKAMDAALAPLVIVGHMHLPMVAEKAPDETWSCKHMCPGMSREWPKGSPVILNPGSVGEVRDAHIGPDYRARWMTLEDLGDTWRAVWHGTAYEGMEPKPVEDILWL